MSFNVVDRLNKMQLMLPIMEVTKMPQQKEKLIKALDHHPTMNRHVEGVVIQKKQSIPIHPKNPSGKVPPFYLSLESEQFILHNCMIANAETNNIVPLSIMKSVGLECTKHYIPVKVYLQ